MQIWDTAGAVKFKTMGGTYYRNSVCGVLVFDLTDPKSFESIESRKNEFLNFLNPKDPETFPFVLIGNKCDKVAERRVQQKEIDEYCATKPNMTYFEVSAKDNKNLDKAFYAVAQLAYKRYKRNSQEEEKFIPNRIELKPTNQKNSEKKEKEIQKLKSTIKQLENDKSNLTKEIQILKKKEKEHENIIMNLKIQINELNNQNQLLKIK